MVVVLGFVSSWVCEFMMLAVCIPAVRMLLHLLFCMAYLILIGLASGGFWTMYIVAVEISCSLLVACCIRLWVGRLWFLSLRE